MLSTSAKSDGGSNSTVGPNRSPPISVAVRKTVGRTSASRVGVTCARGRDARD